MTTTLIKAYDQDWKVTPFHCVVGPIHSESFIVLKQHWNDAFGDKGYAGVVHAQPFDYVFGWAKAEIAKKRKRQAETGFHELFYTRDPLVVNEMLPEETTLIVWDDEACGMVLTNFADMPDVASFMKEGCKLGDYWLRNALGGCEPLLRCGTVIVAYGQEVPRP